MTFNNPPSGASVTWSVYPTGLFTANSGTGTSATLQPLSGVKGYATLTFSFGSCTGLTIPVTKSIWVGLPTSSISGDIPPYPGELKTYSFASPTYELSWPVEWAVSGGNIYGGGGVGQSFVQVVWQYDGYVSLTAENPCGGYTNTVDVYPSQEGGCDPCEFSSIYPNPATEELHVKLKKGNNKNGRSVMLINDKLEVIFNKLSDKNEMTISVKDFPSGLYFLKVSSVEDEETRQIIVKR